ncbi:MAG: S-adenosylmethionine:tRNA ribosyltransferase-isomerase [Chloroflexota bacterium]|nr:S-adenosylmethionine:tRNA ribosyltransferase-isomerase [Chloroflexota bacterium]
MIRVAGAGSKLSIVSPKERSNHNALDFRLPPELQASEPPEARGLARDAVRLMVSYRSDDHIVHARFNELSNFLSAGDMLVINTSGTMNAALQTFRSDGTPLELHLSTHLPGDLWIVELRVPDGETNRSFLHAEAGEVLRLPCGGSATLHAPYAKDRTRLAAAGATVRLWLATLSLPSAVQPYLAEHGFPIRYGYVPKAWPSSYYQTVYATETGSAEMPSAGRAFTTTLLTRLVARGVSVVPLLLHTGVASLEANEPPYEEFYRISPENARAVNAAHASGSRVVAVGTTVVRVLETVTDPSGVAHPGEGWTRMVVTPERPVSSANGMLTGLHEPQATHLDMLEALAGRRHLEATYSAALKRSYLWHEFGDLHLILP